MFEGPETFVIGNDSLPIIKLSYSSGTIEITSVEGYFSGKYQFKLTSTNWILQQMSVFVFV